MRITVRLVFLSSLNSIASDSRTGEQETDTAKGSLLLDGSSWGKWAQCCLLSLVQIVVKDPI